MTEPPLVPSAHPGPPPEPVPAPPEHPTPAAAITPAAEPAPPKRTERPHPLTPLIRGWFVLLAVILGFGRQLIPNGEHGGGLPPLRWLLIGIAAVCVIAALAGLLTWWFTRFVIDADELRVETGAVFRSSKRIAFERIQTVDLLQPLAARMFGLAELRIDVGSGENQTKLRYLSRSEATRLRDYLVARAHGERHADVTARSTASIFTDNAVTDRVVARVSPGALVGAFLLSTDIWVQILILVVGIAITAGFGVTLFALPGIVPLAIALVSQLTQRVFAQFNYTLAESGTGLRITRGLTTLTSQSIPIDRVQGLRVTQPIFWRPFGWFRVDVDVLGIKTTHNENDAGSTSSILQPVATPAQVDAIMDLVLPGVHLDTIVLHPSPRRSGFLRPFDFWTLRYGWDDRVIMGQRGWLRTVREIVPHAKTQSVRITVGPLQRRLRLATVHIDTTAGPVDLDLPQLDPASAREVAMTQLDRARRARAAARDVTVPGPAAGLPPGPDEPEILARFGITADALLGTGSEARVFALADGAHVLRIAPPRGDARPADSEQMPEHERRVEALLAGFAERPAPVQLPLVVDRGASGQQRWRVDRRLPGVDLSAALRTASGTQERRRLLLSHLDVAMSLWQLPIAPGLLPPDLPYGRPTDGVGFATLAGLLADQCRRSLAWTTLGDQVPDLARRVAALSAQLAERTSPPGLVHADLGPANVYVDGGRVTGVGDWSVHTMVADPVLDAVGAVAFVELEPYREAMSDARWLQGALAERLGPLKVWIEPYRAYYGLYYSMDANLLDWCAAQLAG